MMFSDRKQQQRASQYVESLPTLDFQSSDRSVSEESQEIHIELQTPPQELIWPQINSSNAENDSTPLIEHPGSEERSVLPAKQFQRPRSTVLPYIEIGTLRLSSRQLMQVVLILGAIITPITVVTLVALPQTQNGGNLPYYDCTFSGDFTFKGIDIPYGQLTFAQAKAIDLVWNTLCGRTLQTLIAIFAYKVAMKALMRVAEQNPISYDVYAALALSTTKLSTVVPLTRSIYSKLQWQARCAMLWLILTTIYLASFPTLIDATTGYQASQLTRLKLYNGSTADLTEGVDYGDDNVHLWQYPNPWSQYLNDENPGSAYMADLLPRIRPSLDNSTGMQWLSPLKTQPYFTAGYKRWQSHWGGILLGDPASSTVSNITYMVSPVCVNLNTSKLVAWDMSIYNVTDITSVMISVPINQEYADPSCGDWSRMFLWRNGSLYYNTLGSLGSWNLDQDFMTNRTYYECVSTEYYQWGFSYAWLLITCSLNVFWLFGTSVLWLDAECNSELVKKGRMYGTWRAVMDLAEAANHYLGENTCAYSDEELERALEERGPVAYVAEENKGGGHVGLRCRGSGEKGRLRLDWTMFYGQKGD